MPAPQTRGMCPSAGVWPPAIAALDRFFPHWQHSLAARLAARQQAEAFDSTSAVFHHARVQYLFLSPHPPHRAAFSHFASFSRLTTTNQKYQKPSFNFAAPFFGHCDPLLRLVNWPFTSHLKTLLNNFNFFMNWQGCSCDLKCSSVFSNEQLSSLDSLLAFNVAQDALFYFAALFGIRSIPTASWPRSRVTGGTAQRDEWPPLQSGDVSGETRAATVHDALQRT